MKRILLAVTGTVMGLVALLSFKTHPQTAGAAGTLPSAGLPVASSTAAPSGGVATTSAPPTPGRTAASGSTPAATSTAPAATRTIAGQTVQTRYGTVQVQVVVSGKKIENVSFLQLTADDPHSQEINDQAGPMLLQATLSAQSAHIDVISGATYTSDGYLQSLQSALDQAGIQ